MKFAHVINLHTGSAGKRQGVAPLLQQLISTLQRIVTSSSAEVGWIATVLSKSALVAPILMATAKPCSISSQPRPCICSPTTFEEEARSQRDQTHSQESHHCHYYHWWPPTRTVHGVPCSEILQGDLHLPRWGYHYLLLHTFSSLPAHTSFITHFTFLWVTAWYMGVNDVE